MHHFAAAAPEEAIVFGAARPKYSRSAVTAWLTFMQQQGIQRVCCLLTNAQLQHYDNWLGLSLLERYQQTFGTERVCWSPIEDFQLATPPQLRQEILPYLDMAEQQQEKVVVHCSGGVGRTGHILAAWLVARRGLSAPAAIAAVRRTGRNPYEAVLAAPFHGRNPWRVAAALRELLTEIID